MYFHIFPLLLLQNAVLYYCSSTLLMTGIKLVPRILLCSLVRSSVSAFTTDKKILIYHENIRLNCHLSSLKCHIIPLTTDLHLTPLLLQQLKRTLCYNSSSKRDTHTSMG